MSQHTQLAAGSGIVPADGQIGDPFSGPACFAPASGPRPRRVATVGVGPSSTLRRAILWRVFGPPDVQALAPDAWMDRSANAGAVILQNPAATPSWEGLLDWAGDRRIVVDVQAAAVMAAAAGFELSPELAAGETQPCLQVMCHQRNRSVFPDAPAIDIVADPPVSCGFAVGDRVHLFVPSEGMLGLRALRNDEALQRFAARFNATVWGRERRRGGVALLSCPTPGGGRVTVMDLQAVDRRPDEAGSETPAIQILLSLLGQSPVTFGRFVVPPAHYGEWLEALDGLAGRHPRFAALETIGRSVEGHDLRMLKIARRPGLPVVLFTNMMHPYEWAPMYGVLRYMRYLLECLETGAFEADELLDHHQVWWVPAICPDGFANRCQQPSAINLIHNFPDGWAQAAPGHPRWGAYGAPNTLQTASPISWPGPAPGSQPETRALMGLLDRADGRVATVADFHENVGHLNFLHQAENLEGHIADVDYHADLTDGIRRVFRGRFHEHREATERTNAFFHAVSHERTFAPGWESSWQLHAVARGAKAILVEAAGGDCTHYRTVRRTEHAAQTAEQILAAELGGLVRNPWGEDREVVWTSRRHPDNPVTVRLYDRAGNRIETQTETPVDGVVRRTIPAGGCLRFRIDNIRQPETSA